MHRSQSQKINRMDSIQESRSKKFWKSLTGTTKDVSSIPRSASSLTVSAPVKSTQGLPVELSTRQPSKLSTPRTRSSVIVSQPRLPLRSGSRRSRHMSTLDLSTFKMDPELSDPKEIEFLNQLLNGTRTSIISETGSDTNEVDMEDQLHHPNAADMLDSALADYRLFTKEEEELNSPDAPSFESSSDHSEVLHQSHNIVSLPSLPSFNLEPPEETEISVMNISNSLWVGSTIHYDDEGTEQLDAFGEIDIQDVFDDKYSRNYLKSFKQNRTSLLFN